MDATQYEQRVRETARAMGYDPATIDRMFSPEVNAMAAAQDARADQQERHQEARRLALAHVAQEQTEADPGAAQAYEEQFREYARSMGYDARTVEAMAALPVDGGASQARVADLTRRYAEALRAQEQTGGAGQTGEHGRPFEVGDEEFREPRLEDDDRYRVMLDLARHVDRIAEAKGEPATNERDVLRLWECRVALARDAHIREAYGRRLDAAIAAAEGLAAGTQRVQEAVALQATDAGEQAWEVVLAEVGDTKTGGRRYLPEAFAEAVRAGRYDGSKIYLNHEDNSDRGRGHRNVQLWAGTIRPGSVRFDPTTGRVIGVAALHHPDALAIMASPTARAAVGLSQDVTVSTRKGADGRQEVHAIKRVHSVDLVPEGNAVHGRAVIGPAA
jgi:hypothetical protein